MIVVKLQGGLGNQLFQYAMGKAMAKLHASPFALDQDFLMDRTAGKGEHFVFRDYDLDVFSIHVNIAPKGEQLRYTSQSMWDKITSGFKSKHVYKEPFFQFDAHALQQSPDVYLDGYWQSPIYFESVEKELRKEFQFVHPIEEISSALYRKIQSTDSICINVRRDDFLNSTFHGVCDMRYFTPAIQHMAEQLGNPHLFVFSDDKQWCKENFNPGIPMDIVGDEHNGYKYSNKLQLMTLCKHFIIPNSTFAWWAVWLSNKKDSIVIAPKRWFAEPSIHTEDLIPSHWLRFEN